MFNIGPQEVFIAFLILAVGLLPTIFYCLTLSRALARCAPESRAMQPGMVWLLFIPAFNLVWNFIIVSALSRSLRSEFQRRGLGEVDTGHTLGMAFSILACLSIIPIVNLLTCCPR